MDKKNEIKNSIRLFNGIMEEELTALLACLGAKKVKYFKGETVLCAGDAIDKFGIVVSGEVQIIQDDYYGNRNIIGRMETGQQFAESFAFAETSALPVDVIAVLDSEIMFIECKRFISPCSNACGFHKRLILNMVNILSMNNVSLTQKIEITSKHNTREKLLAYLSSEAKKNGSGKFFIPYNRQELADFLSVERSAMSAVLSKLKEEGLIEYNRNYFELL